VREEAGCTINTNGFNMVCADQDDASKELFLDVLNTPFCVGMSCEEDLDVMVAMVQGKLELKEELVGNFNCAVSSAFVSSIVSATSLALLFALALW
jgi:hypothetical protein